MAAGVIAFWVAIGLPVAVFRSVSDPSQIFGIWWVTLGIGVVIALMGIGIMGLFTLQLPKAVYAVNPKADSAHGSFLFGVMTAVLGLPCFGFVAGALLAGSATLPAATIMLIFTSLGAGMAAPYFILAVKPSLIERIPRTGPASELVKQVMGLLLLGAAAYFIGSGLIGLVSRYPYLARQLHWWAAALFVAASAAWMIYRTFQITRRPVPRAVFLVIGSACGAGAIMFASSYTSSAREKWIEYEAAIAARGQGAIFAPGVWNRYTPAAFASARAEGYVVVLDFTAEWCINCKALKAAVLNPEPVRSELKSADIVSFTVDLTDSRDPGWAFLRELGHTGIPVLAVYTPGRDTPWTSNAYTARQVLDALAQARAEKVASR
jgi:thiol:disulfide interchange protein DsbD